MSTFFGTKTKLAQDLNAVLSTPLNLSTLRMITGYTNLYRLVLTFSRLTVQQTIAFLNQSNWLNFINEHLGLSLDADQMIRILNTPAELFRLLSVALFAFRLSLNLGDMAWHWAFPTDLRNAYIVWQEQWNVIINDAVWSLANLFGNYAAYFKIPRSIAASITAVFLCFDAGLLFYRKQLAEQTYQAELIAHPENQHELDIGIQTKRSYFNINLLAAGILALGFSASFILTAPALIPLEFFVCAIGTAFYASADDYSLYVEKSLRHDQEGAQKAWNNFLSSLFKHTLLPCIFMATLAVSLPAAILFAVLYIGYELTLRYTMDVEPQPLCSPS
ncbi:MAG: hypothetical protein ACOYKA_01895 [Legionellaceae bacterium]